MQESNLIRKIAVRFGLKKISPTIFNYGLSEVWETILDMLEPNPEAKLLDLGCGDGRNTLKYATKIGSRNIYGIEIVNEYVNIAQSKNIRIYTADRERSNRKFSKLAQCTCPTSWISTFLFNQHLKEGSQNYFLA